MSFTKYGYNIFTHVYAANFASECGSCYGTSNLHAYIVRNCCDTCEELKESFEKCHPVQCPFDPSLVEQCQGNIFVIYKCNNSESYFTKGPKWLLNMGLLQIILAEYERSLGACDGESIKLWKNESDSKYGNVAGLENCQKGCNLHAECAGFTFRISDEVCGFWKRRIWGEIDFLKTKSFCYRKPKGMAI